MNQMEVKAMTICINEMLLEDDSLKAQHIHTLLQLMKIANKEAPNIFIAVFSLKELMELVKCNNKETVLKYLNTLVECGYIEKLEPTNRKSTYKLNSEVLYK